MNNLVIPSHSSHAPSVVEGASESGEGPQVFPVWDSTTRHPTRGNLPAQENLRSLAPLAALGDARDDRGFCVAEQ